MPGLKLKLITTKDLKTFAFTVNFFGTNCRKRKENIAGHFTVHLPSRSCFRYNVSL